MDFVNSPREARLRDQACERHPDVPAGRWLNAAAVASQRLAQVRRQGPVPKGTRILADADWEFRGGAPEVVVHPGRPRMRWSDHPGPQHRERVRLAARAPEFDRPGGALRPRHYADSVPRYAGILSEF